jgi:uncharacterized protein
LYENDGAHDFDHVLRVLANASYIGQVEGANLDILTVAVLLHDIARAEQRRTGVDHAEVGAQRAEKILQDAGYPAQFIGSVCHAIETHRFRTGNPPQTLEARILYDADKLDAIGAIGIARAFAFGGHRSQPLWRESDNGEHTALQEYRFKLSKIKDKLFTPTARKIAEQRHRYMAQFFEQMAAEVNGNR